MLEVHREVSAWSGGESRLKEYKVVTLCAIPPRTDYLFWITSQPHLA